METVKSLVPHELYIHILEYAVNTPIREENNKNEIILKGFLKSHNRRKKYNKLNSSESYSEYICNFYNEYDPNIIIKSLNGCNCCERHKINKPKHLNDFTWCDELGEPNQDKNIDCFCSCRQSCRFIFRIHNNWRV